MEMDFETVYKKLVNGRRFVKIHEMRSAWNATVDEFDIQVKQLRDEGRISLMKADWSQWTHEERTMSFTDENGVIFSIVKLY